MSQKETYHQVTQKERERIADVITSYGSKCSLRKVAAKVGRSLNTIKLELYKGVPEELRSLPINELFKLYNPLRAQRVTDEAKSRKGCGTKWTKEMLNLVRRMIASKRFSPAQIKGSDTTGLITVSVSTLYRWLNDPLILGDYKEFLRHRGKRLRNGDARLTKRFANAKTLADRPEECINRSRFGDFEADTVVSPKGKKGCIFTFVDRMTRLTFAYTAEACSAACFRWAIRQLKRSIPAGTSIKTITADRGREFSNWEQMEKEFGIQIYFCAPHHPWEKGTNENTNGLIREFFPKGTDFSQVSQKDLYYNCIRLINIRPRRMFGYKSARQFFLENC